MFHFIQFLVGLTFALDMYFKMLQGKVVQGKETTTIEERPYQVSIISMGKFSCSGSIISSNKILTTAHCCSRFPPFPLSVRVGSLSYKLDGIVVPVERICKHPQYNSEDNNNDVCVLVLPEGKLQFGPKIQAIELASIGSSLIPKTPAVLSGWGITYEACYNLWRLQEIEAIKLSQDNCKKRNENSIITDSMSCYEENDNECTFCEVDSGAPLVVGRTQVGIASWISNTGCDKHIKLRVYTNVSAVSIRNHILSC